MEILWILVILKNYQLLIGLSQNCLANSDFNHRIKMHLVEENNVSLFRLLLLFNSI